jgi:hypothetical protein
MTIRIRNWRRFQHYKDRSPPWIKLHKRLLDNPDWFNLDDKSARLLIELWLIASEEKTGEIKGGVEMLAWRLRRASNVLADSLKVLQDNGFVESASNMLADASNMLDRGETEAETETERETSFFGKESADEEADRRLKGVRDVFDYWVAQRAKSLNLPKGPQPRLSETRRKKIQARLDEDYTVEQLKEAVDGCLRSKFHLEGNHTDIELIFRNQAKVDYFRQNPAKRGPPTNPVAVGHWSP